MLLSYPILPENGEAAPDAKQIQYFSCPSLAPRRSTRSTLHLDHHHFHFGVGWHGGTEEGSEQARVYLQSCAMTDTYF